MCPHYYHIIRHDNTISVPREGLAGVGDTVGGNDFHNILQDYTKRNIGRFSTRSGNGRSISIHIQSRAKLSCNNPFGSRDSICSQCQHEEENRSAVLAGLPPGGLRMALSQAPSPHLQTPPPLPPRRAHTRTNAPPTTNIILTQANARNVEWGLAKGGQGLGESRARDVCVCV